MQSEHVENVGLPTTRSKFLSGLTRRLIGHRGGYRASQLLIQIFGATGSAVETDVFGFRMLVDPKDHACRALLYYPQLYEAAERAALLPQIRPGDVVVDVGAHFGVYSLLASKRAAKILSIEADPATFGYLERNLAMNGASNVTAVQAGVSDRRESLSLYGNNVTGDRSGHSFVPGWGRNDKTEVQCYPLPEIMAAHGFGTCDVLKIDVEGFEYRVLAPLIEQSRIRPRVILVEYFETRNTGDVRILLRDHGYHLSRQIGRDYLFCLVSGSPEAL